MNLVHDHAARYATFPYASGRAGPRAAQWPAALCPVATMRPGETTQVAEHCFAASPCNPRPRLVPLEPTRLPHGNYPA